MTENNIHSGFIVAELVLYNPDQILLRLHIQKQTPISYSSSKTSHNLAKLESQLRTIKILPKRRTRNSLSSTDQALDQLIKEFQMAIYRAALLTHKKKELRVANEKRKRKRAKSQIRTKKKKKKNAAESENREINPKNALLQDIAYITRTIIQFIHIQNVQNLIGLFSSDIPLSLVIKSCSNAQ